MNPPEGLEASRTGRSRWRRWAIGGGALAAALLIALNWTLWTTLHQVERLEGQVATLRAEVADRQATLQFLADPHVRSIRLAGLPPSPGATGRLLWNPVTRTGLFLSTGLPQAPGNSSYMLWAFAGAEPIAAGAFAVDAKGRALLWLQPLPEGKRFDRFAVTLEPAGGLPKPSGAMYLAGKAL